MKINWKTRVKHPMFWFGMAGVIMSPVLAYTGLSYADLTTWGSVKDLAVEFAGNPYLIGTVVCSVLGALGVITDQTTKGICDSEQAMGYDAPKEA